MKKILLLVALSLGFMTVLAGCSSNSPLLIWVGAESNVFYTEKMAEYVTEYNLTHDKEFPFEISVKGVDTGTAAATFMDDTDAGADIFTVAHDNLGKLMQDLAVSLPYKAQPC